MFVDDEGGVVGEDDTPRLVFTVVSALFITFPWAGTRIPGKRDYSISFRDPARAACRLDQDNDLPGERRGHPEPANTAAAVAPSAATASANGVGWGRSGSNLGSKPTATWVATPRSSSDGRGTGGPARTVSTGRSRSAATRAMTRALCGREQGGTNRVCVIDPSGQVGGRDHDMGVAAAEQRVRRSRTLETSAHPGRDGPWRCVPSRVADHRTRTGACPPQDPAPRSPVECADHRWLASRPSTLPDSG